MVIDDPAQNHGNGHPERRNCHCPEIGTLEYTRQQHAEDREPCDPNHRGNKSQQDREDNPSAQSASQLPKSSVKIHQRTFCSECAERFLSVSVRGSSTSIVRCSVGRGIAVTMLTPFGAWNRCQAPCGTTTVVPALSSWVSTLSSTMMSTVVEPAMICTSSSPLGWRSQAARPENFAL